MGKIEIRSEIEWKYPPLVERGSERWQVIAYALQERAGEWGVVAKAKTGTYAATIRKGGIVAFRPGGSFEAVARRRADGFYDIYARYVGANVTTLRDQKASS